MAWEDLESKLTQLQNKLSDTERILHPVETISLRDYWRTRLVEERVLWERKLEKERIEKEVLKEQVEQHRTKMKELEWRIEQLANELLRQTQLWEEKFKTKDAEYKLALRVKEEELRLQQAVGPGAPPYPGARAYADLGLIEEKKELEKKLEKLETERIEERKQLEDRLAEQEKNWETRLAEEIRKIDHQLRKEYEETLKIHEQAHLFTTEELARGFAHRLRNSVGIISGLVQICLTDSAIKGATKESLDTVVKTIDELITQIDDFVKLTYLPEIVYHPLLVNRVLVPLIEEIKTKCEEQKIELVKKFRPDLPMVMADLHLLEEAFMNIIVNALEAMPAGGTLLLETDFDAEKEEVIVKFIDTGIGIPEHQKDKIFQSFFTTKRGAKGLGLSRTRRIIDLHHGLLLVESVENKGTTVTVRLPAVIE